MYCVRITGSLQKIGGGSNWRRMWWEPWGAFVSWAFSIRPYGPGTASQKQDPASQGLFGWLLFKWTHQRLRNYKLWWKQSFGEVIWYPWNLTQIDALPCTIAVAAFVVFLTFVSKLPFISLFYWLLAISSILWKVLWALQTNKYVVLHFQECTVLVRGKAWRPKVAKQ